MVASYPIALPTSQNTQQREEGNADAEKYPPSIPHRSGSDTLHVHTLRYIVVVDVQRMITKCSIAERSISVAEGHISIAKCGNGIAERSISIQNTVLTSHHAPPPRVSPGIALSSSPRLLRQQIRSSTGAPAGPSHKLCQYKSNQPVDQGMTRSCAPQPHEDQLTRHRQAGLHTRGNAVYDRRFEDYVEELAEHQHSVQGRPPDVSRRSSVSPFGRWSGL